MGSRKFGGRTYYLRRTFKTKKEAQSAFRLQKKAGRHARVIKSADGYGLWTVE